MKTKILFATILFICLTKLQSQNISFNELLELKKSNLANVEEILTQKYWELIEATPPTDDKMGLLAFGYEVTSLNEAESYVYYFFSSDEVEYTRLIVRFLSKRKYLEYLKEIKANNGKLISSLAEEGVLIKVYTNPKYRFKITTYSEITDNKPLVYYQISIRDIND